ncbi:enoyl-CoA hydratase [Motiliproteus sp. MSK22-1]|uniref:enoyl-CoA hydratase n=1 Tax=Motiliproteus sp. MSK22-1 TaxID=1897630 RepID=UPI0018EA25FB|nr:enoyl-CoA hydratase [Motiliproteus sp. MSK22-1]
MNSTPLILTDDADGIATVTLNRPEAYNALSLPLMRELLAQLKKISAARHIHVVILKGAGRGFCAGHDLKEMTSSQDQKLHDETFQTCSKLMQAITQLPQPVIAQVHGIATAAGCQLVASCDLAIASENTKFATPGVNIGLFCSTPMVALSRTVSRKHAMEMLLLGDMLSAQRAYEIGLINRVVNEESIEESVQTMAKQLATKSPLTIRTGKQAFYHQIDQGLADAYNHCSKVMSCNLNSEDAQEGINAFLNKRPAVWKGC